MVNLFSDGRFRSKRIHMLFIGMRNSEKKKIRIDSQTNARSHSLRTEIGKQRKNKYVEYALLCVVYVCNVFKWAKKVIMMKKNKTEYRILCFIFTVSSLPFYAKGVRNRFIFCETWLNDAPLTCIWTPQMNRVITSVC